MMYSHGTIPDSPVPGKGTEVVPERTGCRPVMMAGRDGVHRASRLQLLKRMPLLADSSMRGVGIVPPYTPKFLQPTMSTRMYTTLGFFSCAIVGRAANIAAPTRTQTNV